jgi:hypothetical protein
LRREGRGGWRKEIRFWPGLEKRIANAVHVRSLHMGASICVLFRDDGIAASDDARAFPGVCGCLTDFDCQEVKKILMLKDPSFQIRRVFFHSC